MLTFIVAKKASEEDANGSFRPTADGRAAPESTLKTHDSGHRPAGLRR